MNEEAQQRRRRKRDVEGRLQDVQDDLQSVKVIIVCKLFIINVCFIPLMLVFC